MATRHLYERDGVAAQLLYSIANSELDTAAAAANELRDSDEHTYNYRVLTCAWLLCDPNHPNANASYTAFVAQDCDRLLASLQGRIFTTILPKPCTLPPPHNGTKLPPPSWNVYPRNWTPHMAGALWWAVKESIRKANHARAAYLCMPLVETDPDSLIQLMHSYNIHTNITNLLFEMQSLYLKKRVVMHAFAGICTPSNPIKSVSVDKGRTFTVSAEALAAWHISPMPLSRLSGGPRLVFDKTATQYWIKATAGAKWPQNSDEPVFTNPDASELFFVSHFPNDIPDEWSEEEKAKSHGQPCLPQPVNPWAAELWSYLRC